MYPPASGDLPRADLIRKAEATIILFGGPEKSRVFFKFTCPHCGERNAFTEPNALYEEGICAECGKLSTVLFGGFALSVDVL